MLHGVTERETGLLRMLFPHLAGLDIRHVEDLGGADQGQDPDGLGGVPALRSSPGAGA